MNIYDIISSTNKVFIHFYSDNSKIEKGFRLEYHDGKFLRMLSIYSFCQKIMSLSNECYGNWVTLRDWPVMKCNTSPGNFWTHFLFNSKIKTTYPGVHFPVSSLTLRPKLGLWWH